MRTCTLGLSVLVLSALSHSSALAQPGKGGKDPGKYGWIKNYAAGKELAQKTGKPMMLVFRCVP